VAIDVIPPELCDGTVATDQRGVARPQGAGCDAGAAELEVVVSGPLIVDDAGDGGDAVPGDGACDTGAGVCTLRAAVDEANADPEASEITITPGLATITVAAELDVTAPLTLHGGGATVSGGGTTRVFDVHAAAVTLDDLTVRDGLVATEGGGVRAVDADIVLDGVTLTANQATAGDGGGIHQTGGTLAVTGSTIAGNGAAGESTIDTSDCLVRITSSIGRGGGVFATGASVAVTDSEISDNTASDDGGGIHHDAGSLEVTSTLVHANHADGFTDRSYDFCADYSTDATDGAGGGIRSSGTGTTIRMSTITANVASGAGGGVHVAGPAVAVVEDSTIAGNRAEGTYDSYDGDPSYPWNGDGPTGTGGGIHGERVTVLRSTLDGNDANNRGGGVHADELVLTASTVSGNHAGGIRTSCGPENCTNTVVGQAGGVYTHWVLDATNVTFDGNVSDAPSSGGAAWTRSTASFRFATVVGNQGGALAGSGNLELHGSIVSGNGGGNCVQAADVSEHTVSPHAACGAEPALQVATTFGPLAANGGPTLTRLPAPGSVSIDVIPAELCDGTVPTDQRGVARPQGAGCDAGAVEQ
jgi:hypothetical protein